MKKELIQVSVLAAAVLLLNGCGGSESSTAPSVATGTAFYVDSAVQGVTVTCGSTVSTTDVNGQFTYEEGQNCMFSIGEIQLRNESELYQGKVVMEDNVQTAQFLQSMDYDGNPENGIMIDPRTADVMAQNGVNQMPDTDQELADACVNMANANIGYQGDFVYEQEAREHMDRTREWYGENGYPDMDQHVGEPNTDHPDTDQHMDQPDSREDRH